jgi:hypothetical protein
VLLLVLLVVLVLLLVVVLLLLLLLLGSWKKEPAAPTPLSTRWWSCWSLHPLCCHSDRPNGRGLEKTRVALI